MSTSAVTLAPPTPEELKNDELLLKTLKELNSFEPESMSRKRVNVLAELELIVKNWVLSVTGRDLGAKVLPFGSYQLNVHSASSDIDVLVVVPEPVSRYEFFNSFPKVLTQNKRVTGLEALPTAYVPIITLKFDGIELDLLFARLNVPRIHENIREELGSASDDQTTRSINAYRVGERLRELVPNFETFGIALRAIKLWAKAVGVYSNALGFLGGISWAILTARTCQLYPTATPSKIVEKMFFVFSTWDWSSPVMLEQVRNHRGLRLGGKMAILTPECPTQNSSHNVGRSSSMVIRKELSEGLRLVQSIKRGRLEWRVLLERVNFFSRHSQFLAVTTSSPSTGFIEARLRKLVEQLENNSLISMARLDCKSYEVRKSNGQRRAWFVGLELAEHAKQLDLTSEIERFKRILESQQGGVELDFIPLKQSALIQLVPGSVLKEGRFVKKPVKKAISTSSGSSSSSSSSRNSSVSPPPVPVATGKRKLQDQGSGCSESKRVKV